PDRTHRESATSWVVSLIVLDKDHRSMPREEQIGSHGLAILDFDLLADDLELLPARLIAVFVGLGGIELVNVKIVLVDGKDRHPKSDGPVVTDRDPRQGTLSSANHVQ